MRSGDHHIAELNIARAIAPLESATMAEFIAELAPVNALADAAGGFVWRLQTDQGDATTLQVFDDPRIIVNMSVWRSVEALRRFVYAERHAGVMAKRRAWFEPLAPPYMVLWWIPSGTVPTIDEGKSRLFCLRDHGPTAQAFTFKSYFDPPAGTQPETAAS